MQVWCFHCEQFCTPGTCPHTVKPKAPADADWSNYKFEHSAEPLLQQTVHYLCCRSCNIPLSMPQSVKERTESDQPGMCDCCRSMIESIGQPHLKDFFMQAHLDWDAENDRRIGLRRGTER